MSTDGRNARKVAVPRGVGPFPSCTTCKVDYLGDGWCGACSYVGRVWAEISRLRKRLTDVGICPDCGVTLTQTGCGHGVVGQEGEA